MPKSKRNTVLHLTKTGKKTKDAKAGLMDSIRDAVDSYPYAWLFTTEHMRNLFLQEIRAQWKPDRLYLGRNAVMRKGMGATAEEEHRPGLSRLANMLQGNAGLLFTSSSPRTVLEWFDDYERVDYARKGNVATETVTLPAGPVLIQIPNDDPSPAAHSLDPQLRALGLPSTLQRGVPTLSSPHTVCKEGDALTTDQAALLKVLGWRMTTFRLVLTDVWDRESGLVKPVDEVRMEVGEVPEAA